MFTEIGNSLHDENFLSEIFSKIDSYENECYKCNQRKQNTWR